MRKRLPILACLAVLLILAGCGTSGTASRSPLESAKLAYADASIAYETAMTTAQNARAAHLVSDDQWKQIDRAQTDVRQYQRAVRDALNLWSSTGTKPPTYDQAIAILAAAVNDIVTISNGVKK
jgi:predicted small lipoprotein YifL